MIDSRYPYFPSVIQVDSGSIGRVLDFRSEGCQFELRLGIHKGRIFCFLFKIYIQRLREFSRVRKEQFVYDLFFYFT